MSFDYFWHKTLRRPYQLHVTTHGERDKPVVILLHGIAASSEAWGNLIELLAPQFCCITIDLLGFGDSPKPQWADYDLEQHVRSIRRTMRDLGIRGGYILAGHSLGSLIATRYACEYPRQIDRLILLSVPVYPPLDTIEGRLALKRTDLLMRAYRSIHTSPRMTANRIRRLSKIDVVPSSVIKHPETWLPFIRSLERCIEQQTVQYDIRFVRAKTDVIYGTLDPVLIGENVRTLEVASGVAVYTFRGGHGISKASARKVASVMRST